MKKYAPLWAFLAVYIFTCLAAAIPFFCGYAPFLILVDYFSGTAVPASFTSEQTAVIFALFLGAPTLFAFGYLGAIKIGARVLPAVLSGSSSEPNGPTFLWLPVVVFFFAVCAGASDLARAGAFARLDAWGSYGDWVQARWALFSSLGYFSFVNIYLVVPVSAAWVILTIRGNGVLRQVARIVVLLIACLVAFSLFQKKALLVNCILIFSALLIHRVVLEGWARRQTWLILGVISSLLAACFALVVLPVYSETSKTAEQVLMNSASQQEIIELNQKRALAIRSVLGSSRNVHLLAYALLAPVTRTAAPAMYYPIVFPGIHEFYGLDFGQDILGYGNMPDDNRVVWKYMYPELPGGSVMVPFQFALYSQVGTGGTLGLCAILGALISLLWQAILAMKCNPVWRSLAGSVLLLFSIYIAMDSVRNSFVSSYGVIWAWLFVILMFFIDRLLGAAKRKIRPNYF